MKKIYFLLFVLLVGNFAYGQTLIVGQDFESDTEWAFTADPAAYSESTLDALPLEESFDYEVGTNLSDHRNWEDLFSGDTITISEGNLDYDGLKASKGNSVTFSENGLDANLPFISETTGAVYASFLFKVSDLSTLTKNGYFVVLGNDYNARFWLEPDGDQFVVGVSVGSKLNVVSTEKYNLGDVIFAVMNYDFADSTCNVWVNPASTDFEAETAPAPLISEGGGTMKEIGRVMLRQDSNTETPTITVDELRVGLTWASVTPKAGAVADGNDWNFSDAEFLALEGDITATQTVSGLTIHASSEKDVTIGTSASTIGDMTYTHRLKLNGSGTLDDSNVPVGRVLSFDVTGNTLISIALTSAGSTDRLLDIAVDSPENIVAQLNATSGVKDVQEYTYTGEAATIYLYSDDSGINLYEITTKSVPTGITQIKNNFDVNVYPNPADDRVFIDVNEPMQVGIYNIAGSLLKSQRIQSKSDYINIVDFKEGIYIIRSIDSDAFAKKLIVK